MAAYFSDDGMYHKRVLLWKSHGSSWVILTPDGDVYLEDFSGSGDPGCDFFKIKGLNFKYWSRVGGAVYRFSEELPDDKLKNRIGEALGILGEELCGSPLIQAEDVGGETGDGQPSKPSNGPRRGRGRGRGDA